jgi:hypothetical protein
MPEAFRFGRFMASGGSLLALEEYQKPVRPLSYYLMALPTGMAF